MKVTFSCLSNIVHELYSNGFIINYADQLIYENQGNYSPSSSNAYRISMTRNLICSTLPVEMENSIQLRLIVVMAPDSCFEIIIISF